MAVSSPGKLLTLVALLAPLAQASAAPATIARDRQQQIFMDSQSGYIDLKTNTAVFYKIRISEGGMSITADQGQANQQRSKDLYFENNVWNFRGNVKIVVEQGQLFSDDAQITFVNNALSKAIANGKPASFEQTVTKIGKPAKGHAETIDYDANKHLVRFLKDAYLTNGDHEILGQSVKYDIFAPQDIAEQADKTPHAIHMVITPPPKTAPPKTNP